jgi:hypothetical protein
MSLLGFQRALAGLVASPEFCTRAIESPETALTSYELTDQERVRLVTMVRDPLMATNCVLYRANRMTPIFMFFPMTCRLLGPDLRRELDAFWSAECAIDLQYLRETERFERFVKKRARLGLLSSQYVEEIVEYEAAAMALRFANRLAGPMTRLVRFSHHPERLLGSLRRAETIPENLLRGDYCVLIEARDDFLEARLTTQNILTLHARPS